MARYAPSALTITYLALYKKQRELRRFFLSYEEAREVIGSTPGIIFEPGTTFREVLGKLEKLNLAAADDKKERVQIVRK